MLLALLTLDVLVQSKIAILTVLVGRTMHGSGPVSKVFHPLGVVAMDPNQLCGEFVVNNSARHVSSALLNDCSF